MASAALNHEISVGEEIDMERVVSDAEYRHRVISRLRRQRLFAESLRGKGEDALDGTPGEDD